VKQLRSEGVNVSMRMSSRVLIGGRLTTNRDLRSNTSSSSSSSYEGTSVTGRLGDQALSCPLNYVSVPHRIYKVRAADRIQIYVFPAPLCTYISRSSITATTGEPRSELMLPYSCRCNSNCHPRSLTNLRFMPQLQLEPGLQQNGILLVLAHLCTGSQIRIP
jgi:hypothetical protein